MFSNMAVRAITSEQRVVRKIDKLIRGAHICRMTRESTRMAHIPFPERFERQTERPTFVCAATFTKRWSMWRNERPCDRSIFAARVSYPTRASFLFPLLFFTIARSASRSGTGDWLIFDSSYEEWTNRIMQTYESFIQSLEFYCFSFSFSFQCNLLIFLFFFFSLISKKRCYGNIVVTSIRCFI